MVMSVHRPLSFRTAYKQTTSDYYHIWTYVL
jgi:hypothetical protein